MSRVLITGVTGQDGHALAQICLAAGDEVYGMVRWESMTMARRQQLLVEHPGLIITDGDLIDSASLVNALQVAQPDIIYNLGALASSGQSWAQPLAMMEINALGVVKLLEAMRQVAPNARIVQASTSEQYGRVNEQPQSERTPFGSLNIYGVAKTAAHQAVQNYRDSYGMHASTALMHNHVSFRRNAYFVDRKITQTVARIYHGDAHELRLGSTEASRDWGWGPEFMQAWRLIGEHDEPGDYILATGESHTVQEFVEAAFELAGLDWRQFVVRDERFMRPTDVLELRGDPSYIEKTLGWKADVRFEEIVRNMVDYDIANV